MLSKRGQAALEFLMTYGWAILVVLVVIGTLAYFGILNPSFLLPEKCNLQLGLYCKDHRIDADQKSVSLRLENGMGKGLVITRIKISQQDNLILCDIGIGPFTSPSPQSNCDGNDCSNCGDKDINQFANLPANASYYVGCHPMANFQSTYNRLVGWHIDNKGEGTIKIPCERMSQSEGKTKVSIALVYFFDDSGPDFAHTMEGELLSKIETINI